MFNTNTHKANNWSHKNVKSSAALTNRKLRKYVDKKTCMQSATKVMKWQHSGKETATMIIVLYTNSN